MVIARRSSQLIDSFWNASYETKAITIFYLQSYSRQIPNRVKFKNEEKFQGQRPTTTSDCVRPVSSSSEKSSPIRPQTASCVTTSRKPSVTHLSVMRPNFSRSQTAVNEFSMLTGPQHREQDHQSVIQYIFNAKTKRAYELKVLLMKEDNEFEKSIIDVRIRNFPDEQLQFNRKHCQYMAVPRQR